ncbi:FAD-binding oxidoreductase [Streptomyces sp. NPDC097640]|uniref:FAD-binding oxidoreductase n=1 Tax=Streptomyces sp. NPDC097640 TaxID=3157229 RepID=UPI0033181596
MSRYPQVRGRARAIEGAVVRRGDPGYEKLRASMVWNELTPSRSPDVIVVAASERDVPEAVLLARASGMRIAVRAGGHSWCGSSLREGGMLIDLSGLRRYVIDPAARTAHVQPGVTGGELAARLARYGLAYATGHCESVAMGGYLLSGGLGWNSGAWGPACASVRRVEAVTADGEVVGCDAGENADLFWAARGAGPGFFAVVTGFDLALHPLPGAVATTSYAFPLAGTEEVARHISGVSEELPAEVELTIQLATADPAVFPTAPRTPVITVSAVAFADSWEEAVRLTEPLRSCPVVARALFRRESEPASFATLSGGASSAWPAKHRFAADTLWSDDHLGALLTPLADAIAAAPSGKSSVLAPFRPASRDERLLGDMAFSVLGRSYVVPYAVWDDPGRDGANARWLREAMRRVEPLGTGHYIAEADLTAAPTRAERSYTPADWRRLREVRARYDPDGAFHSYLSPGPAPP